MRRQANIRLSCTLVSLSLAFFFFLASSSGALAEEPAHVGTDFWLAFPDSYYSDAILIIQSEQPATFSVNIATTPSFSYTGSVTPGSPHVVASLPYTVYDAASARITTNQVIENKGIHVTSDNPVSVKFKTAYYNSGSHDAYLGLPTDSLGTEYILLAYRESVSDRQGDTMAKQNPSEFVLAAVDDDTTVTFTPSCTSLQGTQAGANVIVQLNKGQTYQYKCGNKQDVTGTHIKSDKPMAVFGGNKAADIPPGTGYGDYLVEQILPLKYWGKEYMSYQLITCWNNWYNTTLQCVGSIRADHLLRVLAAEDGTSVTVDNGVAPSITTLNKGGYFDVVVASGARVTSDKPVLVGQYSLGADYPPATTQRDPFMMQLIPADLFLKEYRFWVWNGQCAANVVAPDTALSTVRYDGKPVTGFVPLPGGKYYGVNVASLQGEHVITASEPIGVYPYCYYWYGGEGYPAGLAVPKTFNEVRVIDTISTMGIDLDTTTFSRQPYGITANGDKTILEWRFGEFQQGQIEDISFDVIMKDPVPGEQRVVNHSLEVVYADRFGTEIRTGVSSQSVRVLNSAFDGTVITDRASYQADETVIIDTSIKNLSEYARTVDAKVLIEDSHGVLVKEAATIPAISFAAGETKTFGNFSFATGTSYAGDYRVRLVLYENQKQVGEATSDFTITATKVISSKVTTDKIAYLANQTATVTLQIQSVSPNYIFDNLIAKIAISSQQSANSLYTDTKTIPILTPGQLTELKTYWNVSTNPPGSYPVTLEVRDTAGALISTSSATLTISSEIKPAVLLTGQISVNKQSLLRGEPVIMNYSVTNVGNTDLSQIDLSVLTVHIVELTPYDTLTDQAALLMGQSYAATKALDTSEYTAKDYLVVLRANINGVEETLAGTYFRVEGAPSAPSLSAPRYGSDVATLTPLLTVNNASDPNDDRLTYGFELYADSGLTSIVASSEPISEGVGATAWTPSAGSGQGPLTLQENSTYYWRARAYDGLLYGEWTAPFSFRVNVANDLPTAPTLSSPSDGSMVDTFTPVLTVNNASDPDSVNLTYNFELSLDGSFTGVIASQTGVFEGTGVTSWHPSTGSGQGPLIFQENTTYYWRAHADDWFDAGPWMAAASFFINTANDAPTAPIIVSPSNDSEIVALSTDIVIQNSIDPDSPALRYLFEADTVATFDSSDHAASGSIAEGNGTTSWQTSGLKDNTTYYIRAKASDGLAESPWSQVAHFFVNTANDAPTVPVLANPSDGSGVRSFTPALSVHNSTDLDGDALAYEFEIYRDSSITDLLSSVNIAETPQITSWTVPALLTENNTYYWRARAFDGELYSDWTSLSSFMVNTANDAPASPTLHSPAEGSSIDTLTPALSVHNATDPDSDALSYDFEIYSGGTLIQTITGIPEDISGITTATLSSPLSDNADYQWRARAYDGDRYGAWMDMATLSIHVPVTSINATIDFDPNTLNRRSNGTWVVVYIELPSDHNVGDIDISSVSLNGAISAEAWPYAIGDYDKDGIPDLMVKLRRSAVISLLPNGENIQVTMTGKVGTVTFEGVDTIRVIP